MAEDGLFVNGIFVASIHLNEPNERQSLLLHVRWEHKVVRINDVVLDGNQRLRLQERISETVASRQKHKVNFLFSVVFEHDRIACEALYVTLQRSLRVLHASSPKLHLDDDLSTAQQCRQCVVDGGMCAVEVMFRLETVQFVIHAPAADALRIHVRPLRNLKILEDKNNLR